MVNTLVTHFEDNDRRIFWVLVALLFAVITAYVYFLGVSVYAVVDRKQAEQRTGVMNAQISQLESQYVSLDKNIDLALARERGFLEIAVPRYISQAAPKSAFTLRSEGHGQ